MRRRKESARGARKTGERSKGVGEEYEEKERRWTQKECVGEKEEEERRNSMYEDNGVSSRHTTWWKRSWWIRIDDGSSIGAESGEQRRERLKKPAMETASERLNVKPKRQREREKQTRQGSENTLHVVLHLILQTQRQQQLQQQQPQRRELFNGCTKMQQLFIVINFDLPQHMWHYLHLVGLGLYTSTIHHTAADVVLSQRISCQNAT